MIFSAEAVYEIIGNRFCTKINIFLKYLITNGNIKND